MGDVEVPKGGGLRRRGRGAGLSGVLVEREHELAVLEQGLADARAGAGGVVMLDAPAGKGKSRLLTIAGDMARQADMIVLGAQATELERDFPFGVAIQLFEPRWLAADEDARARVVAGPAHRAATLLAGELPVSTGPASDQAYGMIRALFHLLTNLTTAEADAGEPQPVAMLVDDAHWADRPSLRFVAYTAERLAELPILLVVAVRSGERSQQPGALVALRRASGRDVLHPGSLSPHGVAEIVRSRFPDAERAFWKACARVTAGNPFLLTELLGRVEIEGLRADAETAARLVDLAPESVLDAVVTRLASLPPEAHEVAEAVAVLGDCAQLDVVAQLTELDPERVAHAADALAAVHLFHPGSPLAFVHPLIASTVKASMSPLDRGRAHRRAASILADVAAPPEQVAAHLLLAPPRSDPRAVELLRAAARKALASGAAETAVRMLDRALAEDPLPEVYPEVLAELGEAESAAGLPQAIDRLHDALSMADDAPRRAELALAQGRALHDQGRHREAAELLCAELEDAADDDLRVELRAAYVAAALHVAELEPRARAEGEQVLAGTDRPASIMQRRAIAQLAMNHGLRGAPRARVRELAERAWAAAALDDTEVFGGGLLPAITGALLFADELELDLAIGDAVLQRAVHSGSAAAGATAGYCRMWPLYEQGKIAEAAAAARAAVDARPEERETRLRPAYGAVACCHLQRGQLEQAATALSIIDHPRLGESEHVPFLLDVRAQLRLAQLRAGEALEDALEAGRRLRAPTSPGALAWRSTAALASLALGDVEHARELAAEELELARRFDTTRVVVRCLRVLGLASRGEEGIARLSEAVAIGELCGPRLEYVEALVDLGGALRRSNQRAAARDPLRRALELAHSGGALALEHRARAELTATGARPRREMLTGVASLTPSELRVGELAARGLTTRQIAELLFVTPKTVEFHLRHIYRKLEVRSRAELADVMGSEHSA